MCLPLRQVRVSPACGTPDILVVFLSRTFGVRAAGAYAVTRALYLYQMNGTDFGLRQTGARLVATNPGGLRKNCRFIQRRRVFLAVLMMALGYWYGRFGPVPQDARPMVSLYALAIFGYGLSVDWLAWGMQRFAVMSGARAMVSVMNVTFTIVCVVGFHAGLLIIPLTASLANVCHRSVPLGVLGEKEADEEQERAGEQALLELPGWRSTAVYVDLSC